jgi:putative peptidoglycan lipid II flippase
MAIMLSRISGLLRQMFLSRIVGAGPLMDVWSSALRTPNLLQNLLGEQSLSAAFIPTYSRLLEEDEEAAGRFAGAIFALLVVLVSSLVLLGMLFAEPIVSVMTFGYLRDAARVATGEAGLDRLPIAVAATRLVFPMAGILVLSAWALAILNSHRRFFLPYFAPVLWNGAIVTALFLAAGWPQAASDPSQQELERWLFAGLMGAVIGAILQLGVQLPTVRKLLRGFKPRLSLKVRGVRQALSAFLPALAGRGVVQISLSLNLMLASNLAEGGVAAIQNAGILFALPLSLFGMSVAASELPELSRASSNTSVAAVSGRVGRALRQSMFLIAPSVVGYLAFGFLLVGLLFRGGSFGREGNALWYLVLAGYSLGLLASTVSRLLQNTFFALRDTKTPARIAFLRVAVALPVGLVAMSYFDQFPVGPVFGWAPSTNETARTLFMGALGLSLADSLGAWLEMILLRRALVRHLPGLRLPVAYILQRLLLSALLAVPALALWAVLPPGSIYIHAIVVLSAYAGAYLGLAWLRSSSELAAWLPARLRPKS